LYLPLHRATLYVRSRHLKPDFKIDPNALRKENRRFYEPGNPSTL
jgi:hypothetical protein